MRFWQIGKRVLLFLLVNLLVMVTINLVIGLIFRGRFQGYGQLAAFCLIWGMGGAFISLAISRLMAKWMMGVQVIPPETTDPTLRQLVDTVHGLARAAHLPLPEV